MPKPAETKIFTRPVVALIGLVVGIVVGVCVTALAHEQQMTSWQREISQGAINSQQLYIENQRLRDEIKQLESKERRP